MWRAELIIFIQNLGLMREECEDASYGVVKLEYFFFISDNVALEVV